MSFEQATYSFAGGQPPTPTRTPTSDSFDDQDALQTPKLGSSFHDSRTGWDALDPASSASFQKTPKAQTRDLSAHAAHLLTTPNFALLSPQMPSPDLSTVEERTGSLESMIQTPPPTNSSGTKRKEKQNSKMRTPKADGSNRQLLPKPTEGGSSNIPSTSPGQHFSLDFSSHGMFDQSMGPATAPLFPQQKLFWDNDLTDMNLDFSTDNIFRTPKSDGLEPFVSGHGAASTQASFIDFPGSLGDVNIGSVPGQDAIEAQLQGIGGSGGVDPSLLFGSRQQHDASSAVEDDAMQPYAYQVQEARREKAYAGISKIRKRRKPSVDSPAVVAALESLRDGSLRPSLRRSMTDSYVPRSGRSSSSSSRAGTSHGRSSPLKQIRSEAKKRHRTSVNLVIGDDGRARMETVVHQNAPKSGSQYDMDVDSSAYSSETESVGTNDDELDNYNALTTSFGGDLGSSGIGSGGRFSRSASHSQKSSYSSYYSNNSEPNRSKGKGTSKRASKHIALDPVKEGGSFEDPMAGPETDSAQQALMHSLKASQRGRYSPQKQQGGLEPFVSFQG